MSKVIGIDLGTTNSCVAVMEGSNTRVPGSLVQKTAHRRRDFYEDQDARISIMARANAPLRRIRLCTTEQSLMQPTCQRGGPYVS